MSTTITAVTMLDKILVLAVAQEAGRDDTKPKVVNAVTLEVVPEQAEKLDLARSIGTLSLVLRNQVDKDAPPTEGVRKADLLNLKVASAEAKPAPKSAPRRTPARVVLGADKVEIIRGLNKSDAQS